MPNRAFYDMHIHSCLSPCGDDEMTPCNIAGMASVKGLNIVALTDHNTCGNCPAFISACTEYSIVGIAGAEITTSEDIHVVTLFETLEGAMDFNSYLTSRRIRFKNDPDVFGHQLYMDCNDRVVGEESDLLINAVDVSIDNINEVVSQYGGISYPAHIDKMSNSIVSVFGMIPESDFLVYEFSDINNKDSFVAAHPAIRGKYYVTSSDAHYLWDISEPSNSFGIISELSDLESVRREVFMILKGCVRGESK